MFERREKYPVMVIVMKNNLFVDTTVVNVVVAVFDIEFNDIFCRHIFSILYKVRPCKVYIVICKLPCSYIIWYDGRHGTIYALRQNGLSKRHAVDPCAYGEC